jgi:sec-independent protein translocase protein TatC
MYMLYELAIISVRMVEKRRAAALAAQEAELTGSPKP